MPQVLLPVQILPERSLLQIRHLLQALLIALTEQLIPIPPAYLQVLHPGTYNVTYNNGACISAAASVTINPAPTAPAAPTAAGVTYCQGAAAAPLTATGTALLWYTTATGGTGSATAPTPSTATAGTTSYWVSQTVGGCESPRTQVDVTVTAAPAAPTADAVTQPTCTVATGSVVLSGLPAGNWTINPGGITGTGASTTITDLAPGTYNFTVTNDAGCISAATADVVINTPPAAPSAPVVGTITQPTCTVATGSVVLSGLPAGNWTINPGGITGTGSTTTISPILHRELITILLLMTQVVFLLLLLMLSSILRQQLSPAVTVVATSTSICSGGSITFTATPVNGGSCSNLSMADQWC